MDSLFGLLTVAFFAGLTMPLGACVAAFRPHSLTWMSKGFLQDFEQEVRHFLLAFGAGALVSAVGLVLVPDGIAYLSFWQAGVAFLVGALAFMLLDIWLAKHQTPASQLAAMLSDYLPESLAMGAVAATGGNILLLGSLIAVQNFPEGFNAFDEMYRGKKSHSASKLIGAFLVLALLGPVCALVGYWWLGQHPEVMGLIMLFASGGILYSVFQDIAPQIKLDNHWVPPLGAILGFFVGIVGLMMLHP